VLGSRPQLGVDGYYNGKIKINGNPLDTESRREIAFVLQRDIFFDSLTVREELNFSARLKLHHLGSDERNKRINTVIKALGLDSVLDSKIGSSIERGLSGGETTRLKIGVDFFLSEARLALLDEPLTGLDASRAYSVLRALAQRCTDDNAGIMLSIHQPSSKLFILFDRLLLMAPGGRIVYNGKASAASEYLASIGQPCPANWNPPDHFIEIVSLDGEDDDTSKDMTTKKIQIAALVQAWNAYSSSFVRDEDRTLTKVLSPSVKAPFSIQLEALTRRAFVTAKGTVLKPLDWILVLSLASIWGWLFFDVGRTAKKRGRHAADIVSIIFFFVAQFSWGPAFQQVTSFPAERDVLTKELASQTYSIEAWFISKQIAEIPVSTLLPLAFYIVVFPLVGLPIMSLPATYAVTLLHSWVSTSLAVALSAIVFDTERTTTVLIIIMVYLMCCGGFFIDMNGQPVAISWVRFTSYWYYACGLFLKIIALPYDNQSKDIHKEIHSYSFSTFSIMTDIFILCSWGIAFRLIAYIGLKTSRKIRFS